MTKKDIACKAVERLEELYPDAICSLNYDSPFQLLIATRLSAQCTDARVNIVTPRLFSRFPDSTAMANATVEEIEEIIKSCGLYKTKARDILAAAKMLEEDFWGNIPDSIEELTRLPGVGRKTANLVMGDIFHKPAVVCDTHFIRITNRLGLTSSTNPLKVEKDLIKLLPPDKSSAFCHRIVLFGREICTARKAYCDKCPLDDICPKKHI
ncbi:MAG: endonuclease III [Clostridia bacterium]|nr:endonuclease III [Clostridia bacterium]MBP3705993.1 endonuclease III [Clostridia bacterium]